MFKISFNLALVSVSVCVSARLNKKNVLNSFFFYFFITSIRCKSTVGMASAHFNVYSCHRLRLAKLEKFMRYFHTHKFAFKLNTTRK